MRLCSRSVESTDPVVMRLCVGSVRAQILPRKTVLGHADYTAPIRIMSWIIHTTNLSALKDLDHQVGIDYTDHTDHTDHHLSEVSTIHSPACCSGFRRGGQRSLGGGCLRVEASWMRRSRRNCHASAGSPRLFCWRSCVAASSNEESTGRTDKSVQGLGLAKQTLGT